MNELGVNCQERQQDILQNFFHLEGQVISTQFSNANSLLADTKVRKYRKIIL
jgi:hypothetical protein